MIRLIQRRLIVPRGDTGTFSIPVLAGKDSGDTSIFTIFSPLTHRKIFEKVMENSNGVLKMDLTHGDTVNLPVGEYVWDIKFYTDPVFVDEKLVSGTEVDSYYSAFQLPICEIRETGDNLLMADDAPDSKLAPDQINYIDAAIIEIHNSMDAAVTSAAEASTSATSAETSASAAAASEAAALASQQAAQAAATDAANSAATASQKAAQIGADLVNKADKSEIPTLVSQLQNDVGYLNQETDPTVSAWAKAQTKPSYTAQEVGALPDNTFIPSNVSDLTNDTGFITSAALPTNVSDLTNDAGYLTQETDPTVPAWAKAANKPSYTAQEVGALPSNTFIPSKVSDLVDDSGHYTKPVTGIPATDLEETYLTQHQDISMKANSADLATVATSGSYNDLLNKPTIPTAVSQLTDDSGHYTKPANGIPATDMTSGVQTSLGLADTAYQKPNNGIPASDLASGVIPSVPVQDVQIKNTSILNNGIANIPLAANGAVGLVQGNNTYGTAITAAGDIMIYRADDSAIKNGNGEYKPIVPYTEHQAVFYGLAKAAGDTTQRESQNNVGIYTSSAQSAIQAMLDVPSTSFVASSIASAVGNVHSFDAEVVQSLPTQNIKEHTIYFVPKTGETNDVYDEYVYINNAWEMIGNTQIDLSNYATKSEIPSVPVQDVQINGTSILSQGVANVPLATSPNLYGLVRINSDYGINIGGTGYPFISGASNAQIKEGTNTYKPITVAKEDIATFYGLAKAAGADMASVSGATVGVYPDAQKAAIQNMLGITDLISTEESSTATAAHAINSTFMMGGKLHRATAAIAIGDAVEVGTNCEVAKADEVFVKNTDYATSNTAGIVKINVNYGLATDASNNIITNPPSDTQIKEASSSYRPITPNLQHKSVFYGLAKAAGDTTQAASDNAVGTYTNDAKAAIRTMIGAGTSNIIDAAIGYGTNSYKTILSDNIIHISTAFNTNASGELIINSPSDNVIKSAGSGWSITPPVQHKSVFYGLAKAAGDITQASSSNAVGTYTDSAKTAIRNMLGVPGDVQVNGTSVVNNGVANIPIGGTSTYGVFRVASDAEVKEGVSLQRLIAPGKQANSTFYGLAKASGDTTQASSSNTVGTYTESAKASIRAMLGATSSNVIAVQDEQPTDSDTKVWLPETEPTGIEVPTYAEFQALDAAVVKKTDYAYQDVAGIVRVNKDGAMGLRITTETNTGEIRIVKADSTNIKNGTVQYKPIVPYNQHEAVFFGLSKSAGVDLASETVTVGTYPATASAAIRTMLGAVGDVQVNGTSVITNGVANVPVATGTVYGVVKAASGNGVFSELGTLYIYGAQSADIKTGTHVYKPIVPIHQHEAVFYGLAKAAGDTTQSASSNAVGTYTSEAKAAIHTMLGIDPASIAAQVDIPLVETVSGTTPTITGQPNIRYVCGEVSTITITPPASGSVDVIFESGSTATTMTVPSTVKWPAWFDAEALEANTTYEILITDGIYGSVMTWAT